MVDRVYIPISSASRGHMYIRLENGMTGLLITDSSDKSGSVCVSVAAGSHMDPLYAPGLAHLCEHMIVGCGSKRFPEADTLHRYLVEHNGNQNAFTTGEQTSFYFEVPNCNDWTNGEPVFDKLVGILSDKLKNPIFQKVSISKEVFAVDSEHENNKNVVSKIMLHGLKKLANPASQFARFTTGNVDTLVNSPRKNGFELRDLLECYFQARYTADKMCFVVRGPQSLNYLNKLVRSSFGNLRTGRFKIDSTFQKLREVWNPIYNEMVFIDDSTLSNAIFIQSSKNPVINVVFPVKNDQGKFVTLMAKNYMRIWCDLFGDEGNNSICSYFKSQNFITAQTAQLLKLNCKDDALVLKFDLTTSGWKTGIKKMLHQIFFQFVPSLLAMNLDELAIYLNEWNTLDLVRFLYQDNEVSLMDKCANLASKLLQCEVPEFIFNGGISLPCNYVDSDIRSFYEDEKSRNWWLSLAKDFRFFLETYMTWSNCKFILLGAGNGYELFADQDESKSCFDEYYNFKFWKGRIMLNDEYNILTKKFSLPTSEDYLFNLERNLTHLKQALETTSFKSQNSPLSLSVRSDLFNTQPKLADKNDLYELWIKEEDSLQFQSRTIVTVQLINLCLNPSAKVTMNLEILAQLLYLDINAQLYPAERVGYMYEIIPNNAGNVGLGITISGFPEGVYKILKVILDRMMNISKPDYEITKENFRKSRVALRNKYEEASKANSCTLASLGVLIVLERWFWTLEERLEALDDIDITIFKNFCQELCKPLTNYINLIVQGDVSYVDQMNQYLNQYTGHLLAKSLQLPYKIQKKQQTISLPKGSNFFLQLSSFEEDPTNSIVYFLETGSRDSSIDHAMAGFFEFFMSMTLIPDLRTKKQIGYIVLGGVRLLANTLGIHISIMSNMSPIVLETKINEYLEQLETNVLMSMSQAEFNSKYLQKYIKLIESNALGTLLKNSGPADLMAQIESNVHSSNFPTSNHSNYTLQQHKNLLQKISSRSYSFYDHNFDISHLNSLTLPQFIQFFRHKISPASKHRQKLSVMFRSPMDTDHLTSSALLTSLETFLKINGFHINREKLKTIIHETNGKPIPLFKTLLSHFRSQGQSLRLCVTILKQILKQFFDSDLTYQAENSSTIAKSPIIPLNEITNLHHFKSIS